MDQQQGPIMQSAAEARRLAGVSYQEKPAIGMPDISSVNLEQISTETIHQWLQIYSRWMRYLDSYLSVLSPARADAKEQLRRIVAQYTVHYQNTARPANAKVLAAMVDADNTVSSCYVELAAAEENYLVFRRQMDILKHDKHLLLSELGRRGKSNSAAIVDGTVFHATAPQPGPTHNPMPPRQPASRPMAPPSPLPPGAQVPLPPRGAIPVAYPPPSREGR